MALKRASIDFSAEAIQREINDANKMFSTINNFKNGLEMRKVRKALKIFKGKVQFDVAGMLALVFGFKTVMWILFCIRHVPKVFSRYKNTRLTAILKIVKYLCPECLLTDVLLQEIVDMLEEFAPDIPLKGSYSDDFEEALSVVSKKGEINVSGFLAPPVDNCLDCGGYLSVPNPPSKCILYTTDGPKALTKFILRCPSCKISYGYSMKSNDDRVSQYYSEEIMASNTVLEVTNVSYIGKRLYLWLTSLMQVTSYYCVCRLKSLNIKCVY